MFFTLFVIHPSALSIYSYMLIDPLLPTGPSLASKSEYTNKTTN